MLFPHHEFPLFPRGLGDMQRPHERIVQIKPGRNIIELIHHQNQQIVIAHPDLPVPHPAPLLRSLQQIRVGVHQRLAQITGRDQVSAGQIHNHRRRDSILGHGIPGIFGSCLFRSRKRHIQTLPASLCAADLCKGIQAVFPCISHGGKPFQCIKFHDIPVSFLYKKGVQIQRQGHIHPILRPLSRPGKYIQYISFQNQKWFQFIKYFQLFMPFTDIDLVVSHNPP